MAKRTGHLKKFKFTKADAAKCKGRGLSRKSFGKCMIAQVARRLRHG